MFIVLAAILHLGNVQLTADPDDGTDGEGAYIDVSDWFLFILVVFWSFGMWWIWLWYKRSCRRALSLRVSVCKCIGCGFRSLLVRWFFLFSQPEYKVFGFECEEWRRVLVIWKYRPYYILIKSIILYYQLLFVKNILCIWLSRIITFCI